MKLKQLFAKFKRSQAVTPVLVVGVLMVAGAVVYNFNAFAATAGFSFKIDGAYKVGDTVTVKVFEDSGSQCSNVVRVSFTYPSNLLRYESASLDGSKLDSSFPDYPMVANGEGTLRQYTARKECGTGPTKTSGVSGEQLIGTLTFTAIAEGTANFEFKDSSVAISSSDNRTNVASERTGSSFAIAAGTTPPPPANPNPAPTSPPATKPRAVTAITPVNSDASIPVKDNETVEVNTDIEVNPLPIQPDGVNKVEYLLDGKLKATVKEAPYKYRLDTTKLLNGKYVLTTKTYYTNGQTKSVNQTIAVNNPMSWTQVRLRLQKLAWLIILIIVVLLAAVAAFIAHRRGPGSGPKGDKYDYELGGDFSSSYSPNDGKVVAPSDKPAAAPSDVAAPQATVISPSADKTDN